MASLSSDQVRHIAKLARLDLSDAEVEKFAKELTSILGYVDMLGEVNTKGVEPTAQVTGLTTVLRPDELRQTSSAPDALLDCSPLPITDHHVTTPSAHG